MLALGHETVGFVSLGPVALVLSLRVFFVKNWLSSWYLGVGVALALTLARLLLRDFGPLVPRPLLSGLWWRCWSWVARSCSPGHITASVLVPGPWTWLPRLSPAFRLPSMGWLGAAVCVCLHFLKCYLYYFLEIWDLISLESLVPSSVTFDSFSSSSSKHLHARAHTEERVGVLVWVFIHQPPWLLFLQHGSQVSHTGSPSLLSLNLLFILQVSILSEQMVFCVAKTHFS